MLITLIVRFIIASSFFFPFTFLKSLPGLIYLFIRIALSQSFTICGLLIDFCQQEGRDFANRKGGIQNVCLYLFLKGASSFFLSVGHRGGEYSHSYGSTRRGAHQAGYRGDRRTGEGGGRLGDLQLDRRGRRQGMCTNRNYVNRDHDHKPDT